MAVSKGALDAYILMSMHRIERLYYDTSGSCYLSFSGGKDSTVVLAIIKMCEDIGTIPKNAIPAVYCDTKIELGATEEFVKWVQANYYSNLQIIKPKKLFPQIIKESGKPMKSKMRSVALWYNQNKPELKTGKGLYDPDFINSNRVKLGNRDYHLAHPKFDIRVADECCNVLKKDPFSTYAKENNILGYFTGMRAEEGGKRAYGYEKRLKEGKSPCTTCNKDGIIHRMPIIDWTDEIVEAFVKEYNVPLSKAYTEYGLERTGCFLCPYGKDIKGKLENLYKNEPNRYKAALFYMQDVYIAQGVELLWDKDYMAKFKEKWKDYEVMRYEMLKKYRPCCQLVKRYEKAHGIKGGE